MKTKIKLPLWRCVSRSYVISPSHLAACARISYFWLLVTVLVLSLPTAFFARWLQQEMSSPSMELRPVEATLCLFGMLFLSLAKLPFWSSIGVAWHRFLIINEPLSQVPYFRLDRTVWSYFDRLSVVSLLWLAPLSVLAATTIFVNGPLAAYVYSFSINIGLLAAFLVLLIMAFIGFFLFARLSLILPFTAVSNDVWGFGDAWRATRKNSLRMLAGALACFLPNQIFEGVLQQYFPPTDLIVAGFETLMFSVADLVSFLIFTRFLSLAYLELCSEGGTVKF